MFLTKFATLCAIIECKEVARTCFTRNIRLKGARVKVVVSTCEGHANLTHS
jgi:hypothetical protein